MRDARHLPEFGLSAAVLCDKKLAFLSAVWLWGYRAVWKPKVLWQLYAELLPL